MRLLCRGALDAGIDPILKPWDIGAIVPCVLEAGGFVSDLNGEAARIVERTSLVAASSARGCARRFARRSGIPSHELRPPPGRFLSGQS